MKKTYRAHQDARILHLFWIFWMVAILIAALPAFADETATLTTPRNAFEVSYSAAEQAISHALTEKGVGDKVTANLTSIANGNRSGVLQAFNQPVTIDIKGLQFDRRSHRWSASLLFVANGEVVTALPASGHFEEIIEVPVLKRELRNGDIISENDIEIRDFPMAHIRSDTITDISTIIGKSPLRTISPFRSLRENEIASPAIVKKNGIVQMRYSSPGMEITTSGQAMDDGAKGDVINVRNTASKKVVRAVIEDSNTVNIMATGTQTSQLTETSHATN